MFIKKYLALILCTLTLGIGSAFSFANNLFNIEVQPEFGILHGAIGEYVYEDVILNTDHLESSLDWDIPAIPYIGASAQVTIIKHILLGFNGIIAFPGKSGNMQDYDWLNSIGGSSGTYLDWILEDPTELTNYSIHDNYLDQYYRIEVELGGTITPLYFISVSPVFSYQYSIIQFTGSNGYRKYKSEDFRQIPFNEKVISYAVETNSVKFGLKLDISPVKFLDIGTDVYYSPNLTFIKALDRHYLGSYAFYDKIDSSSLLQVNLSIQYSFPKYHKLGLKCGFEYVPVSTGQDYMKPLDENGNPSKKVRWGDPTGALGGVSEYLWNWSVIYTCCF